MNLWLRARHLRGSIVASLCMVGFATMFGETTLPMPAIFSEADIGVPIGLLVPATVAIAVAWGLAEGNPLLEATASRPMNLWDAAYAFLVAGISAILCTGLMLLGGSELALASGRNALGYVALTLAGRSVLGLQAAAVPLAGFIFLTSLFGRGATGDPHSWAWPLAPYKDIAALSLVAVFLLVGALMALTRPVPSVRQYF